MPNHTKIQILPEQSFYESPSNSTRRKMKENLPHAPTNQCSYLAARLASTSSLRAAGPGTPAAAAAAEPPSPCWLPPVALVAPPAVAPSRPAADEPGVAAGDATAAAPGPVAAGEGEGAAVVVAATGLPNIGTAEPKEGGVAPGATVAGLRPNFICPPPAGVVVVLAVVAPNGVIPNAVLGEFGGEREEGEGTGRCPEGKGETLDRRGTSRRGTTHAVGSKIGHEDDGGWDRACQGENPQKTQTVSPWNA